MLCNKCRAGFILLFYLTFSFCFTLYFFVFFFSEAQWVVLCTGMEIYKVSFCFLGLYCNNSFCFRASDSFCLRLLDILRTPALNLCRVIVPLSLSFSFFFFLFFKSFFHCCISQELVHSSACNHNNSLIMFIDFNIKIIKPLAPHPDSRV